MEVGKRIEHYGLGRQTVATGTANLLIVCFNVWRKIIMNHPAYIAFVYTHAERNRRAYDGRFAVEKSPLRPSPSLCAHTCMIAHRFMTACDQLCAHLFGGSARQAVDDAGIFGISGDQSLYGLNSSGLSRIGHNHKTDIRAVKRADEFQGIA